MTYDMYESDQELTETELTLIVGGVGGNGGNDDIDGGSGNDFVVSDPEDGPTGRPVRAQIEIDSYSWGEWDEG